MYTLAGTSWAVD